MAFPKFYPFQVPCAPSPCDTCKIGETKQGYKCFPGFYTQSTNPQAKKIMLVIDLVGQNQFKGLRNPEEALWKYCNQHRILQIVLSILLTEEHNVVVTHALKCEPPQKLLTAHRKYLFTKSKEVVEKKAAKEYYDTEQIYFEQCYPHLFSEIKAYDPDIIIAFGHRVVMKLLPGAPDGIYTCRSGIYDTRFGHNVVNIEGRDRIVVPTLGMREIGVSSYHASQWKVDIGRALWLAQMPEGFDKIPDKSVLYQIRTVEQFRQLIDYLKATGLPFAWDTETSSLKKIENDCFMLSLSWDGLTSYTIPISASRFLPGHDDQAFRLLAKELLSLPNETTLHNAKFDMQAIHEQEYGNWLPANFCWDTGLMAYTYEENFGDGTWRNEKHPGLTNSGGGKSRKSWLQLATQVTDMQGIYDKQWLDEKAHRADMAGAILKYGWDSNAEYAGKDAIYTFRDKIMYQTLMAKPQSIELEAAAKELLSRHIYTLTRVEQAGLPVSRTMIDDMLNPQIPDSLAAEVNQAKSEFLKLPTVQTFSSKLAKENPPKPVKAARPALFVGLKLPDLNLAPVEPFNINSSTQLAKFFFDHMKLSYPSRSTDKAFISHFAETVKEVKLLKIVRERGKVLGTFLPSFKDNANLYSDFRVRPSFGVYTTTGRTSCTDPNLQQIPRSGEKANEVKGSVKKVIVARPGYCIVAADYSCCEIRMLAMVAKDVELAKVFKKVDAYRAEFIAHPSKELYLKLKTEADFHKQNASNMMGIPLLEVTKEQRTAAKSLSFMIVYSCYPAPNLAGTLGIDVKAAQKLVDAYLGVYKQVNAWFKAIDIEAKETGYARNIFGQRRALYGLYGGQYEVGHFSNVNRNCRVQGPASHWTVLAAHDFQKVVIQDPRNLDIRVVNLVHDAIYVEMPIDLLEEWGPKLLRIMERPDSALKLLGEETFNFVPMAADFDVGLSLYSMATWDDTAEHLKLIVDWLKNGGKKEEIPLSPYDASSIVKIEDAPDIEEDEEEEEDDLEFSEE